MSEGFRDCLIERFCCQGSDPPELGGSQGFYPVNQAALPAPGFPFGVSKEPKAPQLIAQDSFLMQQREGPPSSQSRSETGRTFELRSVRL